MHELVAQLQRHVHRFEFESARVILAAWLTKAAAEPLQV
jgi:hypothetical protein